MPPLETSNLLPVSKEQSANERDGGAFGILPSHLSFDKEESSTSKPTRLCILLGVGFLALCAGVAVLIASIESDGSLSNVFKPNHTGPYRLLECQEGEDFFRYYDFFDGADSEGSAGYNSYVSKDRALELGLANVTREKIVQGTNTTTSSEEAADFIYLKSEATKEGPRESLRLEGNRRYNRGLFIVDLAHMPAGCGVWPAFWLTDEANWPNNGEVDIVEGVNYQSVVKTALHTSESCSMYAHVPRNNWTGKWDNATGIPDSFTGDLNFNNKVEADNCWVMAPHQWANQGCVAISTENGTLGVPLNKKGGGVFILEWDPAAGYIRSWVFTANKGIPLNLERSMRTAKNGRNVAVTPDPTQWGLPYAHFAIGEKSGCSADHFKNMRLIFNLAFCGTVAGNRFFKDCPLHAKRFNASDDPVKSCNQWIASNPAEIDEAYWKIRGVYVYERE
eukprot:scaffold5493_cov52-Attheya_sp.AAC.10